MDVLLLGGPLFLGRHLIDALLAAGHRVTMFNRGQTNAEAYPDVERLVGDRRSDVGALAGRAGTRRSTPAGTSRPTWHWRWTR